MFLNPFIFTQDLRVYISEEETFTQFNDSQYLFWEIEDIEYGDWIGGPNGDGTFELDSGIEATEVGLDLIFFFFYWALSPQHIILKLSCIQAGQPGILTIGIDPYNVWQLHNTANLFSFLGGGG